MVGALICLNKNLPKVVKDKHQKESQRQSKKGNSVSGGYRLYDIYEDNTPKYSYQKKLMPFLPIENKVPQQQTTFLLIISNQPIRKRNNIIILKVNKHKQMTNLIKNSPIKR